MTAAVARPFLKWVGGKGRLLPTLAAFQPPDVAARRHVEPFLGGGAMFFASGAKRAVLSDVNAQLVNTYAAVRDDVDGVIAHLEVLAQAHSEKRFYDVRVEFNTHRGGCCAEQAARFIYLNKTCFNGLYRVNRSGQFNVPAGRYERPTIVNRSTLFAASARLQGVEVRCADFAEVVSQVGEGDFCYLDPPYDPQSATASFCAYARQGFGFGDQERLRDVFVALARRGARVMLSSSATERVRALYRDWHVDEVNAPRSVSCRVGTRGLVRELVVRSYAVGAPGAE